MKDTFILFLFAALAFSGCRKQVSDYDRPDFDPQPTLNAVLQEDQPVWAQVTFAQCLDSVHPAPCTDAEVLLYVDGQFTEKLQHDGKGRYVGDTVDEEGNPCPAFLVTFKTDPNKKEYYQMNMDALFRNDYASGYSFSKGTITSSINTDDPVLLNEGSDRLLFSNEIITETDYTLKVNSTFGNHGWGGDHSGTAVRSGYVVVRMHGLSESAYHYMKSQNAFEEPDAYSNLFLGVISPINLYSNVENGRGVFAAIAPMTCDTVFINPKN